MRVEFLIPGSVPSVANLREHWRTRHARSQRQRGQAGVITMQHVGLTLSADLQAFGGVVTLTRVAPRRLDSDNLASACKGLRDGIADALGVDDGDERLEWRYAQEKCKRGEQAVRVVVEGAALASAKVALKDAE